MRIAHISDLHLSLSPQGDQERVVAAGLKRLAEIHRQTPIDAVVFTGDLAFAGEAQEFAGAQELLLVPLEVELGLLRSQIVILPGNHDVDRSAIKRVSEAGLSGVLVDSVAVNSLLISDEEREDALARLNAWLRFHEAYYDGVAGVQAAGPLGFAHLIETSKGSLGVAAMNTAWRSQGDEEDRGRLILGEVQIDQTLAAIGESELRIAAFHHPLDWLTTFDADRTRSILEGERLIVLTGHEHEADPNLTSSVRGRCLYDRGGCLYQSFDYHNAFSILDLNARDPDVTITVEDWYPNPRGEFAAATRLADDGQLILALPSLSPRHHPHYSTVMDALADQALERSVLIEPPESDSAIRVKDLIVPPLFYRMAHEQARATPSLRENSAALSVPDPIGLLNTAQVVIVSAEHQDDGVTTSLISLLAHYYEGSSELLPIFLDDAKPLGTQRTDRALKNAAANVGYSTDGRPLPPLLVAVDDADTRRGPRLDRLAAHIKTSPENKYLLGAHGDGHAALAEALAKSGVAVERIHVWPFKTSQVRALVSQREGSENDALVDQVSSLLLSNRLPRSPFLISALVAVLRAESEVRVLNESSILAAYARYVLGATDLAESGDQDQDFRGREYLLGCFAEELLDKPGNRVSRAEAERFFSTYFEHQGYARSPAAVLQDLINRRILAESGNSVGFRQLAFLYLFAGAHLREVDQGTFKQHILADPLRYPEVLRHAAALGRNDREILESAARALDVALATVQESIEPGVFDKLFETEARRAATLENLKEELAVISQPVKPDDETSDRMHDIVLSADEEDGQGEDQVPPVVTLMEALDMAGDVLKGCELVSDEQLKRSIAKAIIVGHAVLGAATAGLEAETHEIRDLLVASIASLEERGVRAPKPEEVDHVLRSLLTSLVLATAASSLASPHLRDTVASLQADQDLSAAPGLALIAATAAAVLELPQWDQGLTELYGRFGQFPYLCEVVRDMATNIYRSYREDPVVSRLEDFLVDVYSSADVDKSRIRNQLGQGRIRTQLVAQGMSADERESAIDGVITDATGLD
jgi:predicted MPP superfamily phosphohydrolase